MMPLGRRSRRSESGRVKLEASPIINGYLYADHVPAALMDQALAEGWRHFGSYFFRYSRHGANHVLPLRVRLEDFQFSTSQKRVRKRNANLECVIRDALIDDEKHALFALHTVRFSEDVPDSILTFMDPEPARVCNTKEICLYNNGRLIGAHFLDVGETSTSSVYSIYDPSESKHSLGIDLILRAISLSLEMGKQLYYPGYAYLEPSAYDYKKKLSALEVFDWVGQWQSFVATSPRAGMA
jgi:leucyl-tRNA---protein transferase